jgi:hypothetical protein
MSAPGPDPTWPPVLTNKDWQKKKGAFARMTGKTGIGEQMTKAERVFAKIDWKKFDAREILPQDRDIDKLEAAKKQALALYKSQIEPARKELMALRELSRKQAETWKKAAAIPKSATQAATEVAKAADLLLLTITGNSDTMTSRLKSFDTMIAVKRKQAMEEAKKLDVIVSNLEKALGEAKKNPTKAGWSTGNTSAHQRCRSMCNAIRNIPPLKAKYWKTWQPLGDEYHRDAPDGPKEQDVMKKKIAFVEAELKKFKASYKRDMTG